MAEASKEKAASLTDVERALAETFTKNLVPVQPVMHGPDGILFDFNWGLRLKVPYGARRKYHVRYWDDEGGQLLYDGVLSGGDFLFHPQTYFIEYILRIADADTDDALFVHRFGLKDRTVVIHSPAPTVGDNIAWFHAYDVFRERHGCRLYVALKKELVPLFEGCHDGIKVIPEEDAAGISSYAHYQIGVVYDGGTDLQPQEWRHSPLQDVSYRILGIDPVPYRETPPAINFDRSKREIEEPYVCIASMASGGCKLWLRPHGWEEVVGFLKSCGYRVIDIDGQDSMGCGFAYRDIPRNAEDFTGRGEGRTLSDRASMIFHADFFIGVGSGLSWLAWAVGKPVVLVSGFSLPFCEFHTPYRVINSHACHGCFNDTSETFDQKDFWWCPKHKGDMAKQFECSMTITPKQVAGAVMRIPAFMERMEANGLSVDGSPGCCMPVVVKIEGPAEPAGAKEVEG